MDRMKQLIEILNKASLAYYQQNREIMTDREYDALYDELVALESETGIVLSNSTMTESLHRLLQEETEKLVKILPTMLGFLRTFPLK